MDIRISNFAIIPLFIASFILFAFQYYRVNLLNLRFLMMIGAIVLLFTTVSLRNSLSLVFFLLALVWLGVSLFLLRFLPPPRT